MSESTVSGVVHLIEPTKTFGQKGFRKRLVVLEQDNGRFTNFIPVEFVQDRCDSADQMSVGDEVGSTAHSLATNNGRTAVVEHLQVARARTHG